MGCFKSQGLGFKLCPFDIWADGFHLFRLKPYFKPQSVPQIFICSFRKS